MDLSKLDRGGSLTKTAHFDLPNVKKNLYRGKFAL